MNIAGYQVGPTTPFFLLAGPCVVESEKIAFTAAEFLKRTCEDLGIFLIYKSSFDKANRTSLDSFRGLGIDKALRILSDVKAQFNLPLITDVHEDTPFDEVACVVDMLQTPAFLCRQTNFIQRACATGLPVNIKKGQFLAPEDMQHVVKKAKATGNEKILVCERGVSFGYHNLVVDMRSLQIMRDTQCPVVFDATHSVQLPSAGNGNSSGQRQFVPSLARAAVAIGIHGLFMETHPNPDQALSDGPNSWPLAKMPELLAELQAIDQLVKSFAPTTA